MLQSKLFWLARRIWHCKMNAEISDGPTKQPQIYQVTALLWSNLAGLWRMAGIDQPMRDLTQMGTSDGAG